MYESIQFSLFAVKTHFEDALSLRIMGEIKISRYVNSVKVCSIGNENSVSMCVDARHIEMS